MQALIQKGRQSQPIRDQAAFILQGTDQHDMKAVIGSVQRWVQDNITFQRDPKCLELVQSADTTLRLKYGDCDDQAVLIGTILQAVGIKTRFRIGGERPGSYVHVFVEAFDGTAWLPIETIYPLGLGESPNLPFQAVVK